MNATIEKNITELNGLYISAQIEGLCKNKKEFAQLVGIVYVNLVAAMNGNPKYCNEKMIALVKSRLQEKTGNSAQEPDAHDESKKQCSLDDIMYDIFLELKEMNANLRSIRSAINDRLN